MASLDRAPTQTSNKAPRPMPSAEDIAERHARLLAASVFAIGEVSSYKAAKTRNGDDYVSCHFTGVDAAGNFIQNVTVMAFGEEEIRWLDITPTTKTAGLRIAQSRNLWRPVGPWTEAGMNAQKNGQHTEQAQQPEQPQQQEQQATPPAVQNQPSQDLAPSEPEHQSELESMTVAQLRKVCAKAELKGYSHLKKSELIALIENAAGPNADDLHAAPESENDYGNNDPLTPPSWVDEAPHYDPENEMPF